VADPFGWDSPGGCIAYRLSQIRHLGGTGTSFNQEVTVLKQIKRLVLHCSDSTWGDAKTIDEWHRKRKPPFREIGYHGVILNGCRTPGRYDGDDDGLIEAGRSLDHDTWLEENEVGAHALGFNSDTIAWCLIGGAGGSKSSFTKNQYYSALVVASYWKLIVPDLEVVGHGELPNANKACPVIDMNLFRDRLKAFYKGSLSYKGLMEDLEMRGL